MLTRQTLETLLTIGLVFCFLGCDIAAWWVLTGEEIRLYRRAFRRWMVRKWAEEEAIREVIEIG